MWLYILSHVIISIYLYAPHRLDGGGRSGGLQIFDICQVTVKRLNTPQGTHVYKIHLQ